MYTAFLELFLTNLRLSQKYRSRTYDYDQETKQLIPTNNLSSILFGLSTKCYLILGMICFALDFLSSRKLSLQIIFSFGVVAYRVTVYNAAGISFKMESREELVNSLNRIFKFEKSLKSPKIIETLKVKFVKLDIRLLHYAMELAILSESLLSFIFFFKSPYVGRLIPQRFRDTLTITALKYFWSGVVAPLIMARVVANALTVGVYHFVVVLMSFTTYISNLVDIQKSSVAVNLRKHSFQYKQINLLVNEFNSIFSVKFFLGVVIPAFSMPMSSIYIAVSLKDELNPGMTTVLIIFGLTIGATQEIILTLCANVWSTSVEFMTGLRNPRSGDKSYEKRLVASLNPMRIMIGESNFVEMSTPLVMGSLGIQQIANLLCLRGKT